MGVFQNSKYGSLGCFANPGRRGGLSERRHILSTLANIKFFTVDGFSYFILAHTTTWSVFKMGVYIPPVRSSILNGRGKVTFCYGITVTDVHK